MEKDCLTCKFLNDEDSPCLQEDAQECCSPDFIYWELKEPEKSCSTCKWNKEDGDCFENILLDCVDLELWEQKEPIAPFKRIPGIKTAPKNNVQENKPKMSLLPMDLLKKYLVPAYEEGLVKYHRESWRGGFQTSIMIDAAMRHIEEFFWKGQNIDIDSPIGKHHLAGAIFSLLCILHTLDTRPELDDRKGDNI